MLLRIERIANGMALMAALSRRKVGLLFCAILLAATFVSWPMLRATREPAAQEKSAAHALRPSPAFFKNATGLANCTVEYEFNHRMRRLSQDSKKGRRTGYVLCLAFREQQTRAAANMFTLQCWAKMLSVNIVEPFIRHSRLVVPLDASQDSMLAFSDLFNMWQWDALTTKLGFAPLAPWREFLSDAPREVIVVHLQYSSVLSIQQRIVSGEKATHLAFSDAYKEGCVQKPGFTERLNYLTQQHDFKVVREVCVNFKHGDEITISQFNQHILGPYRPREVTVLMDEWRGLAPEENGKRVLISVPCWSHNSDRFSLYLQPSQGVFCDAHSYQQMYLGGGRDYVGVIVRTEKIMQFQAEDMQQCLQQTLERLASVQKKTGLSTAFLSMDIGKYGSSSNGSRRHQFDYSDFVGRLYGAGESIEMWERTFESVTSVREAGYIAALQKVLVAQARCLVIVGGGSFQRHTILLHRTESKRRRRKPCVHILKSCSRNLDIDTSAL